ncbi:hypothetical protein T09_6287 [Trichinella sp. T9]|nr:hypothetical protein T09_6287 [Trichinella sp. T9]
MEYGKANKLITLKEFHGEPWFNTLFMACALIAEACAGGEYKGMSVRGIESLQLLWPCCQACHLFRNRVTAVAVLDLLIVRLLDFGPPFSIGCSLIDYTTLSTNWEWTSENVSVDARQCLNGPPVVYGTHFGNH